MDDPSQSVTVRVKAVPGASRDSVVGMLGDRIKVRISAAPEGGKANKAISKLLARSLGLKPAAVSLVSGQSNPEKILKITGIDRARLNTEIGFDASAAVIERSS